MPLVDSMFRKPWFISMHQGSRGVQVCEIGGLPVLHHTVQLVVDAEQPGKFFYNIVTVTENTDIAVIRGVAKQKTRRVCKLSPKTDRISVEQHAWDIFCDLLNQRCKRLYLE